MLIESGKEQFKGRTIAAVILVKVGGDPKGGDKLVVHSKGHLREKKG
jgi:hypothetical protein